MSAVQAEAEAAMNLEREKAAAVERTARKQATKKAELMNEKTW